MIEQQALRGRRSALSWQALFTIALALLLSAFSSAPIAADLRGRSAECRENAEGRLYENLPAPWARTTSTEVVHTRIGGQDFYVPRNYFRHPQIGCGVEESGMLLRVLLPDLEPYSEETAAVFESQLGFGRNLNILVAGHPPRTPLDKLLDRYREGRAAGQAAAAPHGLLNGGQRHGDDLFFFETEERVDLLIRCAPFRPKRGAGCSHHFTHGKQDVKLGYGREHLPEWRAIQAAAERLIDSFAQLPNHQ